MAPNLLDHAGNPIPGGSRFGIASIKWGALGAIAAYLVWFTTSVLFAEVKKNTELLQQHMNDSMRIQVEQRGIQRATCTGIAFLIREEPQRAIQLEACRNPPAN